MKSFASGLLVLALLGVAQASPIYIETVPVGNPGNGPDVLRTFNNPNHLRFGAVDYEYSIGKHEVTAGQYAAFLNAVAKTDTYGLYRSAMWTGQYSCKIQRSGSSGNYTYSVESDWANRPVNYVSWSNAARFTNWLHNGQSTGAQDDSTTENGAYNVNGQTHGPLWFTDREIDATWFLPTEDEWYKAAYHKGDGMDNYWIYPTNTNVKPGNDLGNPNTVTLWRGDYTIGSPYWRTEVGVHHESGSPYGTFDQGGNLWEWNEARISSYGGTARGMRGGAFNQYSYDTPHVEHRGWYTNPPADGSYYVGFRVARVVPEPGSITLLGCGLLALLMSRRRRS